MSGLDDKSTGGSTARQLHAFAETLAWAKGYQEGRCIAGRRCICIIGEQRFGQRPAAATKMLDEITDPDRLFRIAGQLLLAAGWDDLLATR